MIGILRDVARALSSYRRWYAGLIELKRADGDPQVRAVKMQPNPAAARQATVVDLAAARRVRCLSEPCANTRLAIALLRSQRERRLQRFAADFLPGTARGVSSLSPGPSPAGRERGGYGCPQEGRFLGRRTRDLGMPR